MEVYEIVKSIGSGSFGQVYLARHKYEDKNYVIKKIKIKDMLQKDKDNTEQEVGLLKKLRHTNIVAYKDSFMDREQYLNIVMVYCEGGDMYNKIKNNKGTHFPEDQILDWFAQMSLALYYLHEIKILHRDLKTQNIFLKHGRVRLGDFGIAKVLDSTRDFANTCIGTPYYMSPELFKYKPYSYKSDIWALGCVLYEMCNLKHAFDAQSLNGLAVKILKGNYVPINPTYSKPLKDLITQMLSINPKQRPNILEILKKPMVKKKVIKYMTETFASYYSEKSTPNDLDDLYLDSLKEQAKSLEIWGLLQDNLTHMKSGVPLVDLLEKNVSSKFHLEIPMGGPAKQTHDNGGPHSQREAVETHKVELKKVREEKKSLESRLKKLQQKRIIKAKATGKKSGNDQGKPKPAGVGKEKAKLKSKEGVNHFRIIEKDASFKIKNSNNNVPSNRDSASSTNQSQSTKDGFDDEFSLDHKEKVLKAKQLKKLEEEKNYTESFRAIGMQNIHDSKLAQEKKIAQYRPSSGMGFKINNSKSIGDDPSQSMTNTSTKSNSIQFSSASPVRADHGFPKPTSKLFEEKSMNDEQDDDDDKVLEAVVEDDAEDSKEIDEEITELMTQIQEKTMKERELRETINMMTNKNLQLGSKISERIVNENISDNEEFEDEDQDSLEIQISPEDENTGEELEEKPYVEEKKIQNPHHQKILERIKLLKHRCTAGLGEVIYDKSFKFLSENFNTLRPDEMRKKLIEIMGEDNIGFWHLMDQILFHQDVLKSIEDKISRH